MIYHSHGEEKGHDHAHHDHQPQHFNRAFLIAIGANSLFVVAQLIFAFLANSTSLLADAVHNLGDVLSLVLAWIAHGLMQKSPTAKASYGWKKSSILAALANGSLLIFSCGIIATEAIYKLFSPTEIQTIAVMIVAGIGILVNGLTAMLFMKNHDDLNIHAAFLHLLYDALISVGVVLAAVLIYFTGWFWLDPLVGLMIAVIILKGTWTLFTDSFRLMIDAVPKNISWEAVQARLAAIPGVDGVHDLHIWALSTRENALSVHLYMPDRPLRDDERQALVHELRHQFKIHHCTVQIEQTNTDCDDQCQQIPQKKCK